MPGGDNLVAAAKLIAIVDPSHRQARRYVHHSTAGLSAGWSRRRRVARNAAVPQRNAASRRGRVTSAAGRNLGELDSSSELRGEGIATKAHDRLALPVAALLLVACALASSAATASSSEAEPISAVAAGGNLLGSCLASPAAPTATTDATIQVTAKTTWGFWLTENARGFAPGEPMLAWLFDPKWEATPSCIASGKATTAGTAHVEAAVWYRATTPGSYKLCLVGVHSGRTACGTVRAAHPK